MMKDQDNESLELQARVRQLEAELEDALPREDPLPQAHLTRRERILRSQAGRLQAEEQGREIIRERKTRRENPPPSKQRR